MKDATKISINGEDYYLITDYRDNEKYRKSLNTLTQKTFGFDFEEWYQQGYWSDKYRPFSLLYNEEIVANVSASTIDFLIEGELRHTVQIGTVMTEEGYRSKGLSKVLMNIVMKEYEDSCELFYLYANDSVLNFYPKYGFLQAEEYIYSKEVTQKDLNNKTDIETTEIEKMDIETTDIEKNNIEKFNIEKTDNNDLVLHNENNTKLSYRKLNVNNSEDKAIITRLVSNTQPISRISMMGNPGLNMFYLISFMANDIYYMEALDLMVVAELNEDNLYIVDLFCDRQFDLDEVIYSLNNKPVMKVTLGFTPLVDTTYTCKLLKEEGTTFFIRGKNITGRGKFPVLSHA